ncbi:Heavy metal transport/detoxification protein [Desulfonatronospira thiodismutans ASO3-1]|uniref:Heavy metal transport/detoxification protein n=1 Tax=Desulfonatronospira thiodismutans ASO3-1 TaxID=555779 RepID=D6SQU2_9BACT|nr:MULTISPECIES: cation transporter [Desulfonatronospira]EFI35118.1 Heavy metal transport/detoxification protein [Desulfonatronospira thiodismutans ASO3-1]RQD76636.1 MAG: heavy-metal-associated domain-containing protein [Desulfonatronospira sp. MSAO_Bac3]
MARIKIEGMSCGHCVKAVTDALNKMPGVSGVQVSLESGHADIDAGEDLDMAAVKKAVEDAGYKVIE